MKQLSLSTLALIFLMACNNSNSSKVQETETSTQTTTIDKEASKNNSPSGIYTFSDNSAELEITVSGETWSGKTKIISGLGNDYDNQNIKYDNGAVKGNELYESSGMVKIGEIDGNSLTTSIAGKQVTLNK
jgi:hypothetical protein